MRSLFFALSLTLFANAAVAATCEESFQKKGGFFEGTVFSGRVQVPELSVDNAFSQLRPIFAREGIRVLSEDRSIGTMKAQNPETAFQRALPIDVFATTEGTALNVEIIFTMPSGVAASKKTVQKHICDVLNQLRSNTATPVAPGTPPTSSSPPTPAAPASSPDQTKPAP